MSEREEKIKFIESLLDFISADLSNPSLREKTKWLLFLVRLMGPIGATVTHYGYPVNLSSGTPDEDWSVMLAVQESWNAAVHWLVTSIEVDKAEAAAIYYEIPRYFTWGPSNEFNFSHHIHPYFEAKFLEARVYDRESLNNPDFYSGALDELHYKKHTFPPGFLSFLEALSGFPSASLKSCLHCHKIFFAPTNLRKIYCSPHCQKVASVYRSRRNKKLDKYQGE